MIFSSILLLRRYLETSHFKIPSIFLDESSTSWQISSTLVKEIFFKKKRTSLFYSYLNFRI